MANDDLKAFKISDQVKQPIDKPKPAAKKEPAPSVGFPRIEAVVESGDGDIAGLQARMSELQELSKAGTTQKAKSAAKKAATAYERTLALLSYLLDTKSKLQKGG